MAKPPNPYQRTVGIATDRRKENGDLMYLFKGVDHIVIYIVIVWSYSHPTHDCEQVALPV